MAPVEEKALYVGEAGNVLSDGTPLIPHETICLVPTAEAQGSEWWEPVSDGAPASPYVRNAAPGGTPPGPPVSPPAEDVA